MALAAVEEESSEAATRAKLPAELCPRQPKPTDVPEVARWPTATAGRRVRWTLGLATVDERDEEWAALNRYMCCTSGCNRTLLCIRQTCIPAMYPHM